MFVFQNVRQAPMDLERLQAGTPSRPIPSHPFLCGWADLRQKHLD